MQLYQTKKGSPRIKLEGNEREILDALEIMRVGGHLDAKCPRTGEWISTIVEPRMVGNVANLLSFVQLKADLHLKLDIEWREFDYLVTMWKPGKQLSFVSISVFSIERQYLESEWHRQIHSLPGRIAPERENRHQRTEAEATASLDLLKL
jgi:hypothetical protein